MGRYVMSITLRVLVICLCIIKFCYNLQKYPSRGVQGCDAV
jgi:hypothetical protein